MPVLFRFSDFILNTNDGTLSKAEKRLSVTPRAMGVLQLLVERAGTVVTKQEFFDIVWAETFVEDNSLTVAITSLRKALGDDAKNPTFIENLPRRGYRFLADVTVIDHLPSGATKTYVNPPIASSQNEPTSLAPDAFVSKSTYRLKTLVIVGLIALCLVAAFGYRALKPTDPSPGRRIDSVAVLPFVNSDTEHEYLVDGIYDGIATSLAEIPGLKVISRNSTFQYKGREVDATIVGRELKTGTVLSGKIVISDEKAELKVRLTDTNTNFLIWDRAYEGLVTDTLRIRDEIVRDATEVLRPASAGMTPKIGTDDREAFLLYLKGRHAWNLRTESGFLKSIEYYQQAIDRDPTFAQAYAGLAASYFQARLNPAQTSAERSALIEGAAKRALEIDPNLGTVYAMLGLDATYTKWDKEAAAYNFQKAIELSPNDSTARHWYAEFLAMQGRFPESFEQYDIALSLDPLSFAIMTDRALNYYYAGQDDRAIEELQKIANLNPNYLRTHQFLYFVYRNRGMHEASLKALERSYELLNLSGQLPDNELEVKRKQTEKSIQVLRASGVSGYWKHRLRDGDSGDGLYFTQAVIYTQLGDRDAAFENLNQSITNRDGTMSFIKVAPEWNKLRSDPRFAQAVKRVWGN